MRPPGALPAPRPPLSPASYPGTVVKAWHTGDALVSLLSFLQEGHWAVRRPLDTVPADALGREGGGQWGMGLRRPGRAGWKNPHLNSARAPCLAGRRPPTRSFSSATSLRQFCSILRRPNHNTGFAFPPGRSCGGAPPKPLCRHFPGVWEEAKGPTEGPSVPAVPTTCTHREDTPRGFRLKRPAPNSFPRSKGSSCRSTRAFCRHPWDAACPVCLQIPAVRRPVCWA